MNGGPHKSVEESKQLECGLLEETQKTLDALLSSFQSRDQSRFSNNSQRKHDGSVDFESIFEQNGLLDIPRKGSATSAIDVASFNSGAASFNSATYPPIPARPDRPLTLSRPGLLPSCCNFKRQHWRLYVQGEFSYNSLPRHYLDTDEELNSSYKEDLEKIIRELSVQEENLESKHLKEDAVDSNVSDVNRKLCLHNRQVITDSVLIQAGDQLLDFQNDSNTDDSKQTSHGIESHRSSTDDENHQKVQLDGGSKKPFIADQNLCLMEDIKKNCDNIRNQLAVLDSISEMIDKGHVKPSIAYESQETKTCVELINGNLHATKCGTVEEKCQSGLWNESFTNQFPFLLKRIKRTHPVPVYETPPPPPSPPSESIVNSDLTPSCTSSPSKKLKSRRSRNRSLQRCNEEKLSATERRSRTLSPSITERLDYKVSRATQTNDVSMNCNEIDDDRIGIHGRISPQVIACRPVQTLKCNTTKVAEKCSGNNQELNTSKRKEFFKRSQPLMSSFHSFGKKESAGIDQCKQNMDSGKLLASASFRESKKSQKSAVSFAAFPKLKTKESEMSSDHVTDTTKCTEAAPAKSSEAEPTAKQPETLLDQMHKKLYPYQYNKQNRVKSTETLGLDKAVRPVYPSTLPLQRKSPLLTDIHLRCSNTNPEHKLLKTPFKAGAVEEQVVCVSLNGTGNTEDTCLIDVASPSSGYSEMSSSSLKENSVSPMLQKRLNLTRDQSTTSSSSPSPPDGSLSQSVNTSKAKNLKDLAQLQILEKQLTETCESLVSSGFPQYVQLYREGQFPVALTTVESDHGFLDQDCLHILLRWITLLNKLASMKIRLPLTSVTRDWFAGEMLFALSPIWYYDSGFRSWFRSDKIFARSLEKTRDHSSRCTVTESTQCCSDILKRVGEADCCSSPTLETHDEVSVHLTSGYESEASPISALSVRPVTSLQRSPCSSSQTMSPPEQATVHQQFDMESQQGNALGGHQKNLPEESLRNGLHIHQEEIPSETFLNDSLKSVLETCSSENIPQRSISMSSASSKVTRSQKSIQKDSTECSPLLQVVRKLSSDSGSTSSTLAASPTTDHPSSFSCNSSCKLSQTVIGGNRKSVYDNTIPNDPQAELDMILKELYRNIGYLNETLISMDGNETCNSIETEMKSSEDNDNYSDVFIALELPEPSNTTAATGILDTGISDREEVSVMQNSDRASSLEVLPSRKSVLSIEELVRLRKLCLLKLTSTFEKHRRSQIEIISMLRILSSCTLHFAQDAYGNKIFGVPLVVLLRNMDFPLPPTIMMAMEHLKSVAYDSVGIFRKPGVLSRIQQLQNEMEADPAFDKFDGVDAYDLADVLKRYFREVPESLLPVQTSKILLAIFTGFPCEMHLGAVQSAMLLLSDVSRQVLHVLLTFLAEIAEHSQENQMHAGNLAVCFLPSFFPSKVLSASNSFLSDTKANGQSFDVSENCPSSFWDHRVAVDCITFLINNAYAIFQIPEFIWNMLQASSCVPENSSSLSVVNDFRSVDILAFLQRASDAFHFKDSEWQQAVSNYEQTEVFWRSVDDDHLLPMWKCVIKVEAPPGEVLARLKGEQHLWDSSLVKGRIVERMNDKTDVFQCVMHLDRHEVPREFCELRTWKSDSERGSYILALTSVLHSSVPPTEMLRAITLASYYLIEPCGAGMSRISHISRVDIRGHLLDWYYAVYGRLLERHLDKLRAAFTPVTTNTDGPETNL